MNYDINHFDGDTHGPTPCGGPPSQTPGLKQSHPERSHANGAIESVKSTSFEDAPAHSQNQFAAVSVAFPAGDRRSDDSEGEHADCAGCGVPGDPAPALIDMPMNHQTVLADGHPPCGEPLDQSGLTSAATARRLTTEQLEDGHNRRLILQAALPLLEKEISQAKVAELVGVSEPWLCRQLKRCTIFHGEKLTAAEKCARVLELPTSSLAKQLPPGRKPKYALSRTEAGIVAAHNLQSNRTATSGSPQEALKHAMKRGEIGADSHRLLQGRIDAGLPLLTTSMRRQIEVGETTVRADRTPRGAWLQYVQSPGSLQITIDEATGEERMFQPGEWGTIDDATINLILTVPIERPGDKCWDKFGVMVGRFQFIVPADHRSYFIPGFSFTARPRSSYRAEDLTATMHTIFREHGMWRGMFLEMGISKSNLVHETLKRAGIAIKHVHSPHQKVVEALFNKLWTKLSFLPGQVGRSMKDDEEMTKLMMSCRAGATDPRKYFLPIDAVVKALHEAINEHNAQTIMHSRYGKWIPNEFWSAKAPANLRPLAPDCEWMFAPTISPVLTVKGFTVRTTVKLMDGLSQAFHFSHEKMQAFHGAKVRVHYNPFLDAPGKIILAEDFKGTRADSILFDAEMIDRHARFNLRKLSYGQFPDIGLAAARQNAQALVRVVKATRPDGKPGIVQVDVRNQNAVPRDNTNTAPAPQARFLRGAVGMGVEQEEFERAQSRLARDEERSLRRATRLAAVADE